MRTDIGRGLSNVRARVAMVVGLLRSIRRLAEVDSVCVPVALHAAGNLLALAGQVGVWYWPGGYA